MPHISICIPTYEMHGRGKEFLQFSFDILKKQTFQDFDIVISDQSRTDEIENLCHEYEKVLDIQYIRNKKNIGNTSANLNNAIRHARGILIKILFQDDFLYDDQSLYDIVRTFDVDHDQWLATASIHSRDGIHFTRPFYPKYHRKIHLGNNTMSSPSVLTIKNTNPLLFDEKLVWLMDCDYYKRCFDNFGKPKKLQVINVVNRIGAHQVSNTIANASLRAKEYQYIRRKYAKKLQLSNVTLVAVSSIKIKETIEALRISMQNIHYYDVLLISHKKPQYLPENTTFKRSHRINAIEEYSKFIAYDLADYIDSDYALVVQYDGYVLRPNKWDNNFLRYDYIGAPWKQDLYFTEDGMNVRVGNGGFSLRSKKLLNALNKLNLPFTDRGTSYYNEDGLVCLYYRNEMEKHGIRFAPVDVASKFSHETTCDDSDPRPFGFHKNERVLPLMMRLQKRAKQIFANL